MKEVKKQIELINWMHNLQMKKGKIKKIKEKKKIRRYRRLRKKIT